jgi:hypothetical protein
MYRDNIRLFKLVDKGNDFQATVTVRVHRCRVELQTHLWALRL